MSYKHYTCTALKRKPPVINYYCIQIFAQQTTCLYTFGSFTLNTCNVYHTYCIYFHLELTVEYDRFTFCRKYLRGKILLLVFLYLLCSIFFYFDDGMKYSPHRNGKIAYNQNDIIVYITTI